MVQWWWEIGAWLWIRSWGSNDFYLLIFVVIVCKILPHILASNGKCLQDIHICEDTNKNEKGGSKLSASEQHLANRLRFSLRVSINVCDIYLRKFYLHFYFYFYKKILWYFKKKKKLYCVYGIKSDFFVCFTRPICPSCIYESQIISACYCVDELSSIIILLTISSIRSSSCTNLRAVDLGRFVIFLELL